MGIQRCLLSGLLVFASALALGCGDDIDPDNPNPGSCGDGVVDTGEQCDDGNTDDGDGCSASCTDEAAAVCGDGAIEGDETCDDGNDVDYDGCDADCTLTPAEVVCEELTPLVTGVCDVVAGRSGQLIRGDVLTPNTILRGGQVAVDGAGVITCVGCDCSAQAATASTITCPRAVVSPGLINPHDHLTFTHNVPYTDTGERYEHRHDWRRGLNGHTEINVLSSASGDQIRFGELRFLLGGATSVIGAGSATGFLRNLDRDDQEGLGQPQVELDVFPLGDGSGTQRESGCFYPSITDDADIAGYDAYSPHVSEGIDANARNEFVCLSRTDNGGEDLLEMQSAFIHGAGLTPIDYTRMNDQGTLLIWSPRSNVTLYGDTAQVTTADRLGVPIALGTDWIATGSMNLLRELRCADGLNRDYYDAYFTDRQLWEMVTVRAAEAGAVDDVIGTLEVGKVADIAIFDASLRSGFRAVIDAEAGDVTLVMRGGAAVYGDANIVSGLGNAGCDALDVCGASKSLCTTADIGVDLAALQASVGPMYDLFFCTEPANEPSCIPARPASVNGSTVYDGIATATDADGDGIEDASDNCPNVFNPIRPVDDGAQADFDRDGDGDMCDVCPMDADTTECNPFSEGDPDQDGILTADDNCPELANPDQADADSDQRGDVCDACAMASNPAPIACPATIYEVKTGQSEDLVSMDDVLVTACAQSRGFFLQVHPGDAGYAGVENSGLFVFDPNADCGVNVSAGDRITITPSAQVGNFFGQTQLSFASFMVNSSGNPLPPPTVLTTAQAAGTGTANEYEGVLATVENVGVTDVNPPPGPGDSAPTNEFVVDSVLRIDDLIHLTASFPTNGAQYDSISGVLAFRNNFQKLEPTAEADLVPGPPVLIAFAPDTAFVRVGEAGVATIPEPITVTVSAPPVADLLVPITSSDVTSLTVVGGGATVAAGQTTATVLVNGLQQSPGVTLTANLNGTMLTADVRVVGAAEVPQVVSVDPNPAQVTVGNTLAMTVTLDIPSDGTNADVGLATAPGTSGSVPATVSVAADQITASFDFTANMVEGTETVTATLGGSMATATVVVDTGAGLIINEVDYDQVGGDTDEFVELLNAGAADVDLSDVAVVLVNGSVMSQYTRIDLAGTLSPGQYAVIGSQTLLDSIDNGAVEFAFGAASNNVQNGAPDGIGIFEISSGTLLDALSYEGDITAASTDFGTVNLVEGTATAAADSNAAAGSVCRLPDGTDTDDADSDWAFTTTITPGAANVP